MEYHEIGERFEYNGVTLEVTIGMGRLDACEKCYFSLYDCLAFQNILCNKTNRLDETPVYFKLIEQCKPKDNNNMENQIIYYADLDPCDNTEDYKEAAFVPQFVLDDDTEPPVCVVQLATRLGWCIVARWCNNGFTRIYALEEGTVKEGIEIVQGPCAWYGCSDVKEIRSKKVKNEDISVFNGCALYGGGLDKPKDMEHKTEIKVEGTDKVFATQVTNIQSDEEIYGSLLDKLFATYKSKNADYGSAFAEMFDELGIDYAYGKLREKMNRIKVLRKQPNMVENEGLEDALLDTAGYAILTLVELKKRKK